MNFLDGVERPEVLVAVIAGLVVIGLVWLSKHLGRRALQAGRWLVQHTQRWLTRNKPVSTWKTADPCDGCGNAPPTVFHGHRTSPDGPAGFYPAARQMHRMQDRRLLCDECVSQLRFWRASR